MPARPCGVYVSVDDLKKAASGAFGVSPETTKKVINLIEESWRGQDLVDVMLMAEKLWLWRHDLTDQGRNLEATVEFEVIMERIKDSRIVPTIGRRGDTKQ